MSDHQNVPPSEMLTYMYNFGLEGNIVDHTWSKIFRWKKSDKNPNGKPHLEAIFLLSDIVYWYRPSVDKDENGRITLKKRFSADILQRSYSQIEESLGISDREAKTAMQTLEESGVAWRVFRTIIVKGMKIPNVMYIEFNPIKLKELMVSCLKDLEKSEEKNKHEENYSKNVPPYDVQTSHPPRSNVTRPTFKRHTNTETTSENSTKKDNVLTMPSSTSSELKASKQRFIQKLSPEARKIHDEIIRYIPEHGDKIPSDTVCVWFNMKNPFTVNQVRNAFAVYKQDEKEAKLRNSKISSMGAAMRAALNQGRTPRNDDADFNRSHAEKIAVNHSFIEVSKRYVTFMCGGSAETVEFDIPKHEFIRQFESKLNLSKVYA